MPRVLVLTGIFPNRRNPTWGVHILQNVSALAAVVPVRVVAPVPFVPRALARGRYAAYTGVPASDDVAGVAAVYPRFLVVPRVLRSLHGLGLFLSILRPMRREVRSFRPEVILSYFAHPYGFAAVLFGRLFRIPVVISCRGSDVNYMTRPRVQGRVIAWALRTAQQVVVVSLDMRERVLALGVPAARVAVVSNGVDARTFRRRDQGAAREALGVPRVARVAVCVSRLSAEKGIDVLVDAAAVAGVENLRVYVVGDGVERAALAARIAAKGLDDVVTMVGARAHAEIPEWLAAADVVVLPSHNEGMPNAVLEALACGRPVVATSVGGTSELVASDDLGILVPPGDAPRLAAAMAKAFQRVWEPERIAQSVASRTWEAVGARVHELLAAVAAGAQPATGEPPARRIGRA